MNDVKKDLSQYKVLVCGLDPTCRSVIDGLFSPEQFLEFPYDLEKLMEPITPAPVLLLFGNPPDGMNLAEVAQVARMQNQNQPIFYLTSKRSNFDRKDFQKNGFTDAFLIPLDTDTIIQSIKDELARATKGTLQSYRQVQLIDLRPNEILDFDTFMYMPVNKKHIKMSAAGDELDQNQYEKLVKSRINSVHVTSDQIQKFYEFSAKKLKNLQTGSGLSETERKERMKIAIRNLMASVFNDDSSKATVDEGRNVVSDCQQIVKNFITTGTSQNWYEKMLQVSGAEGGVYNHVGNVATFAALFSLAVSIGKPEEVALAGLLHDMGLADIPAEIQFKPESERTPEEETQYRKHVDHTLNVIKFRKMILPDSVIKAITQHHERWSGTGYPKGVAGSRISVEAQLIGLADTFDYMTMSREGKPRMAPAAAFKAIYEQNLANPSTMQFNLELLKQFMSVFPEEEMLKP